MTRLRWLYVFAIAVAAFLCGEVFRPAAKAHRTSSIELGTTTRLLGARHSCARTKAHHIYEGTGHSIDSREAIEAEVEDTDVDTDAPSQVAHASFVSTLARSSVHAAPRAWVSGEESSRSRFAIVRGLLRGPPV